jgi:hypothetical protein
LLQGYEIKFYNAQDQQVGSTQSFGGWNTDQYNTQDVKTRTFSNLDKNITKLVFTSNASKGYDITEASYTRWSYATPSESALTFEAQALSTVADQTFTLDYANYQIELSIEGSSNFVLKSEDSFGDCETYGSKTVKVGYNVPSEAMEETYSAFKEYITPVPMDWKHFLIFIFTWLFGETFYYKLKSIYRDQKNNVKHLLHHS